MDKVVAYLLEKETITGAEMVAIIEGRDLSTVEDAYASTLAHEQGFRPLSRRSIEPAAKKVHIISEKIEAPDASPGLRKKANSADNATQPEAQADKPAEPKLDTEFRSIRITNSSTGARNRAPVLKNITLKGGASFDLPCQPAGSPRHCPAIYEVILDHEDATGLHYTGWDSGVPIPRWTPPRAF
ncbi:MAG: hypothetical protein V8R27_00180 [Oscillospiraceae bacterium]